MKDCSYVFTFSFSLLMGLSLCIFEIGCLLKPVLPLAACLSLGRLGQPFVLCSCSPTTQHKAWDVRSSAPATSPKPHFPASPMLSFLVSPVDSLWTSSCNQQCYDEKFSKTEVWKTHNLKMRLAGESRRWRRPEDGARRVSAEVHGGVFVG